MLSREWMVFNLRKRIILKPNFLNTASVNVYRIKNFVCRQNRKIFIVIPFCKLFFFKKWSFLFVWVLPVSKCLSITVPVLLVTGMYCKNEIWFSFFVSKFFSMWSVQKCAKTEKQSGVLFLKMFRKDLHFIFANILMVTSLSTQCSMPCSYETTQYDNNLVEYIISPFRNI